MHLSCGYEASKLHLGYNEDLKEEAVNIPTFATASTTAGYFNVGTMTNLYLKEVRLWNQIRSQGQIRRYLYQ